MDKKLQEPNRKCRFEFLLIHPTYADLRQNLEKVKRHAYLRNSDEIKESVERLLSNGDEAF